MFKFPFLSICDEQCVLDRLYSIARKNLSNFTVFLELVFTSKAFFTPHYNQSDSWPPAYSRRREGGHICSSFGNPEKPLYDNRYPVRNGTKKSLYYNHHSKQRCNLQWDKFKPAPPSPLLFCFPLLTNKTDRPWLSFSSAVLVKSATPLMWPKEGAWELFHFAITDSSLCYNLYHNHRWSTIMISWWWSLPSFESSGKKSSPAPRSGQPVHRRGGEERWLATTLMCLEAIFRPYCMVWVTTDYWNKNTIRDGGSTALYTVDTVDSVYTV